MRLTVVGVLVACGGDANPCEQLAGPVAALEQLTQTPLELRSGYASEAGCYQYVDRRGRAGGGVVTIEAAKGDQVAAWTARERLAAGVAVGEATLFAAGAQRIALVKTPNRTIKIVLDAELFTADEAKTYVAAVAQRAR